MTSSIEDLVVRQSPGVLHVVLTTSDEDLVAWQSPEASPLRRFDDLGQRGFLGIQGEARNVVSTTSGSEDLLVCKVPWRGWGR